MSTEARSSAPWPCWGWTAIAGGRMRWTIRPRYPLSLQWQGCWCCTRRRESGRTRWPGAWSQLPAIDWGSLVDNPAEMRSGWNFLKDPRNTFGGVKGDSWLTQRIAEEPRLREEFIDVQATNAAAAAEGGGGGRGVVWRSGRVREWVKALRVYKERDLVLVQMTGGLPGRGGEVVTIECRSSGNGERGRG